MQTQDQHRYQKIRKIAKNYVPISDFASRLLNLRKPEKSKKFSKRKSKWRFTWILNFVLLKLFLTCTNHQICQVRHSSSIFTAALRWDWLKKKPVWSKLLSHRLSGKRAYEIKKTKKRNSSKLNLNCAKFILRSDAMEPSWWKNGFLPIGPDQ